MGMRKRNRFQRSDLSAPSPAPMEIGNVQSLRRYPRKDESSLQRNAKNKNYRRQDLRMVHVSSVAKETAEPAFMTTEGLFNRPTIRL
jgi:hypothetical protein